MHTYIYIYFIGSPKFTIFMHTSPIYITLNWTYSYSTYPAYSPIWDPSLST